MVGVNGNHKNSRNCIRINSMIKNIQGIMHATTEFLHVEDTFCHEVEIKFFDESFTLEGLHKML